MLLAGLEHPLQEQGGAACIFLQVDEQLEELTEGIQAECDEDAADQADDRADGTQAEVADEGSIFRGGWHAQCGGADDAEDCADHRADQHEDGEDAVDPTDDAQGTVFLFHDDPHSIKIMLGDYRRGEGWGKGHKSTREEGL
jgi:hypothetical protein